MQYPFCASLTENVFLQTSLSYGVQKGEYAKEVGFAGSVGAYERGEGPELQLLNGRNALEALYGYIVKLGHCTAVCNTFR